jgi:PadR family transcriptional regulator, regulatory protein PadR
LQSIELTEVIYMVHTYLRTEDNLNDQLIKSLLDVIILCILKNEPEYGYKIIADVHKQFGVLLSPGTLYPLLYRMEKDNLIEVLMMDGKKTYRLTTYGEEKTEYLLKSYRRILMDLGSFMVSGLRV